MALQDHLPPNQMGVGENERAARCSPPGAAYCLTGSWNIDTIRDLNPKAQFDFMAARR